MCATLLPLLIVNGLCCALAIAVSDMVASNSTTIEILLMESLSFSAEYPTIHDGWNAPEEVRLRITFPEPAREFTCASTRSQLRMGAFVGLSLLFCPVFRKGDAGPGSCEILLQPTSAVKSESVCALRKMAPALPARQRVLHTLCFPVDPYVAPWFDGRGCQALPCACLRKEFVCDSA